MDKPILKLQLNKANFFICPRFKYKTLKRFLLQYLMNCFLISGQFSNKQFKCFTFERNAKTTITYDLSRVRANSCQVLITAAVEENNGQSRSTVSQDSKPCSYVPECFSQGKSKFKKRFTFLFFSNFPVGF